jgi:hypothetical protein
MHVVLHERANAMRRTRKTVSFSKSTLGVRMR